MLTTLLKSTQYGGCVAACGLVAGHQLEMTVYPFLLRGISLCGAASADCPKAQRLAIWDKLASDWKPQHLEILSQEVGLDNILGYVEQMRQGQVAGRVIVKI
jgi:D-arabinose 1-dehydrogenase-like Zn-dependent alcohol dehydrogenase